MVVGFAALEQPSYLFLGNETNVYNASHTPSEWADWISMFEACYDAIHFVSPETVVFTVFQLEFMKGLGAKTGNPPPQSWSLIDDHRANGKIDALGFTSYPYSEYDSVADLPADYYQEIASHWTGPLVFSGIGWLGADSGPYRGSELEQVAFQDAFFEGTRDLALVYVSWLFLHDLDQQSQTPAIANIGLRDNQALLVRFADTSWQAHVFLRESTPAPFAWKGQLGTMLRGAKK